MKRVKKSLNNQNIVKEDFSSPWCHDHTGRPYSFDEYIQHIEWFHGYPAPGLIVGGKMVDEALKRIPEGVLFDAVCETGSCLPDAIQLLTPCTAGNGWMKILSFGRYALAFYDKTTGQGVRIAIDPELLKAWPEYYSWFFVLKPKKEQDVNLLWREIRKAGEQVFKIETVQMRPHLMKKHSLGEKMICPLCGESYPSKHGAVCRGCQEEAPYVPAASADAPDAAARKLFDESGPALKKIPVEEAEGQSVLHDMTRILPGEEKGPLFQKGQVITGKDLCRLQQMGRMHLYVDAEKDAGPEWVHENDAAIAFARYMAGDGVTFTTPPREGKVTLKASRDGLLELDERRLEAFNMVPNVMCAGRQNYTFTLKGRGIAGTRAVPLYLARGDYQKALRVLDEGPLFLVKPLRRAKVGILVTGTEVFRGLVQDRFIPIIKAKVEALNCTVAESIIVPDDRQAIADGVRQLLSSGADLIVTTAGLSVDPDDVTRQGLTDAGADGLLYGAPVLPGAMTLLGHIQKAQLIGVPACALYYKTTAFDLFLPRLLAGVSVKRSDIARMGHGAFCLECKQCTFPKCPFGK